jgi:hypothetical protein
MVFEIRSSFCDHEIKVDGTLNDPIWAKARSAELVNNSDGTSAKDSYKTLVRSCWTNDNLYFALEAGFEELFLASPDAETDPKSGKTWTLWDLSDVFEIFIGPNSKSTKKYREFQVSPDSRWIDIIIDASGPERKADFEWISGMEAKSILNHETKKWVSILRFPFTAFDCKPKEFDTWNLNFYRMAGKPENRILFAWSPTFTYRFHIPEKFGNLVFSR